MAESIEVLYQNSLLASAAYVDWERKTSETEAEFRLTFLDKVA